MDLYGMIIGWDFSNISNKQIEEIIVLFLKEVYSDDSKKDDEKYNSDLKKYINKYTKALKKCSEDDYDRLELLIKCFDENSISNILSLKNYSFIGVYIGRMCSVERIEDEYKKMTINGVVDFLSEYLNENPSVISVMN